MLISMLSRMYFLPSNYRLHVRKPQRDMHLLNMVVYFFVTQSWFSKMGVCSTKMGVCFLKMGVSFFENRSLFYENGSLFFRKWEFIFRNGSLFYKNGSLFFRVWPAYFRLSLVSADVNCTLRLHFSYSALQLKEGLAFYAYNGPFIVFGSSYSYCRKCFTWLCSYVTRQCCWTTIPCSCWKQSMSVITYSPLTVSPAQKKTNR